MALGTSTRSVNLNGPRGLDCRRLASVAMDGGWAQRRRTLRQAHRHARTKRPHQLCFSSLYIDCSKNEHSDCVLNITVEWSGTHGQLQSPGSRAAPTGNRRRCGQHLQLSDALSRYLGNGESTLITGARGGSVAATVMAQPLIRYCESCHTERSVQLVNKFV